MLQCHKEITKLANVSAYNSGLLIRYAAYARKTLETSVHVPNVRAESGVTWWLLAM
jgi:hypothetical protein